MNATIIRLSSSFRLSIVTLLVLGMSSSAWAQVGLKKIAQSTMNFQLVSISPAASALGEAYSAIGKGAESIFYNPAGIVETDTPFEMRIFSTQWIADINYLAGALTWKSSNYGSIGLSFLTVDYGTLKGTSLISASEISLYPHGYKETGDFSAGANSIGLSYGKAVSHQFLVGGNVRLINQNLGQSNLADGVKENDISKLAFDAGVKYYTIERNFWFGMSIRNFSSNIKREVLSEQLPLQFTLGIAMNVFDLVVPALSQNHGLLLALDFQHPNNYTERTSLGLEYSLRDMFLLRGGYYSNHDLASWSIGFGVNSNLAGRPVIFDYSYSNMEVFDGVNRFSISFSL